MSTVLLTTGFVEFVELIITVVFKPEPCIKVIFLIQVFNFKQETEARIIWKMTQNHIRVDSCIVKVVLRQNSECWKWGCPNLRLISDIGLISAKKYWTSSNISTKNQSVHSMLTQSPVQNKSMYWDWKADIPGWNSRLKYRYHIKSDIVIISKVKKLSRRY